jgi:serine/threonine protein phosphatase 1
MIGRIRSLRGRADTAAPAAPDGTRLYAIGDIHGRVDLLRTLKDLVHEDAYRRQAPRSVVIYLGDYVDRGAESRAVIELLLNEPLPGFESHFLKGNHEDIMLRFLTDISVGPSWLSFGGMDTLRSYGIDPPRPDAPAAELQRAQRALAEFLPRDHLDFLRRLEISHEEGDYLFVHAGVKPGVPLDEQREEDLLWIRDEFLSSEASFGRIVVHGHTIRRDPDVRRNRIGIDTGAFKSDRLTALVAEGTEWFFLQT